MRTIIVNGRGLRWVGILAISGMGVATATISATRAQGPASDVPKAAGSSGPRTDDTRAAAHAVVVQLTEQVRLQRSQLRRTEASLEQAKALLRSLGGEPEAEAPALPSLPSGPSRSPFEIDTRGPTPNPPLPPVPARGSRVTPSPSARHVPLGGETGAVADPPLVPFDGSPFEIDTRRATANPPAPSSARRGPATFEEWRPNLEQMIREHGSLEVTTRGAIDVRVRIESIEELERARPIMEQVLALQTVNIGWINREEELKAELAEALGKVPDALTVNHELRMRDMERKLDRILKALEKPNRDGGQ